VERTHTATWGDPAISIDAARSLSGIEWLRAMMRGDLPGPPLASLIGMTLLEIEEGAVVVTLTPAEYHYNPLGVLHGGIAATLFDSSLGCAVQTLLPAGMLAPTLQLQVNYIRPVIVRTGQIYCSGRVVHPGRQTATAEGRMTDTGGTLLAHATGTFVIKTLEGSKR
jgi:uncharacterized protein (TIGR00369 family)